MFVELTGKDFVPAFMLVDESESDEPIPMLFAPEEDFNELEEGLEIIKKFLQ
jgi:tetrahydromethanopterin S-methyltransferase subunit G